MLKTKEDFTRKIRVLYVEDEQDIAEEMYDLLSYTFDTIYVAKNGHEGLSTFSEHKPDIILTDIRMPIMNGIEMATKIKTISPQTPIIVTSAFSDSEYLKQAIDLGVSDYIFKPIDFNKVTISFEKIITNLYREYELEIYHKELVISRQKAVEANAAKSMFLSSMSHEIRTPLNAIMGFVQILSNEVTDEKLLSYVNIINANSESLLSIINDILDVNKIESGKFEVLKEYFEIHKTIKDVVALFNAIAEEKSIRLELNLDSKTPLVCKTDALRLKQILSNLLSNAIKFTPMGGTVTLNVEMQNSKILFSVKDSGIGISKEYQKIIFEPFTQEDGSTTKKYGGTGLGLSISHKLAEFLGSELKVKSELGEGSEFSFSLDVECLDEDETLAFTKDEDIIEVDFKNRHILLVEDNKSNQMFMEIILESIGCTLDIANHGEEAVSMFKQKSYDLILMDENMPVLNGMEATKRILTIESEKSLAHTPIVALTANAIKGDRERFLNAGMDEYLTKPLDKEVLIKVLLKTFL